MHAHRYSFIFDSTHLLGFDRLFRDFLSNFDLRQTCVVEVIHIVALMFLLFLKPIAINLSESILLNNKLTADIFHKYIIG